MSTSTRTFRQPVASTSRLPTAAGRTLADATPSSSSSSSTSKKRRYSSPSSSSSSDQSDFGDDMRDEAKRDSREQKHKLADAEWKRKRKQLRDRGEEIPKELKQRPSLARMKGKQADKGKGKVKIKDDELAVLRLAKEEKSEKRAKKGKQKAYNRENTDSSSGGEYEKPTWPSFDLGAKKREVEKRTGFRTATHDEGEDDIMAELGNEYSDHEETIRKHLARRWLRGRDPLRLTPEQARMERKYNPLFKLMNLHITIISGAHGGDSSSDGKHHADHTYIRNETDSDGEDESHSDDGTDWGTDGMGEYNGTIKTPPSKRFKLLDSEEEDVKPTTTPQGSPSKSMMGLSAPQEDVKPDIVVRPSLFTTHLNPTDLVAQIDDDEGEPSTEEDEPANSVKHVGPSPATLLQSVKKEEPEPLEDVDMADDSGAEPDTEGSDVEIVEASAALDPHFSTHSHAPSSSQIPASSQLFDSVKAESQSQLSQPYSQSASQRRSQPKPSAVKVEPKEEEMDEDEEKDEAAGMRIHNMASLATQSRRAQMQLQIAEDKRRKEEEAKEQGREAFTKEEEGEEEEEEELPAWKAHEREDLEARPFPAIFPLLLTLLSLQASKVYPVKVKKGRPKFLLESAKQAAIGPHILSPDPSDTAQIPAPINKFLRPYQREGAEFLYGQFKKETGGILGDDMGLGKTIQVIAFLSAVMGKTGYKKDDADRRKRSINSGDHAGIHKPSDLGATCLIICPSSVVGNWEREFQTWGYFDVAILAGDKKKKREILQRFDRGYVDVVIAGYEQVRSNIDELKDRDFTLIIADEAHRIKNPKSGTTQAVMQLNSKLRYGLTGTAVQNRLSEFWCVLNFVVPGRVGTKKQWDDLVARPIKYAQKVDATDEQLLEGRSRAQTLVTSLLPHFWLRRTKESVKLQLPKKIDNIVLCPLTQLQVDVYRRLLKLEDVKIMLTADDPCDCGERDAAGLPYKKGSCCQLSWTKLIFKYIILLQKVSNHLGLIYPDKEDKEKNIEKYEQDLEWVRAAFPDDWQKRRPGATAFLDPNLCGKWKYLCELLELWHSKGDKVLIFSMSLKVIDLLKDLMETTSYKYLALDGSTPQDDRMPLVDEFNDPDSDVFCFLISTRAGGVGLNLTAANRVVIFDPNWNPSHDLQAMDRAYRFGQRREVQVFRLIGAGTLEELIYNRQQYKRALASTAYDANAERRLYSGVEGEGKSQQGELWGVKNIFKFSENVSLTEKSIQRADLSELQYAMQNASTNMFDDDGKARDLPDELDEDELVAEVTGYSAKAAPTQDLTKEQLEQQERHAKEQEAIARILGGVATVQSDATLGGSSIESTRARQVVQNHVSGKKPSASPSAKSKHSFASSSAVKPDADPTVAAYDPFARGRNKSSSSRAASSVPPAIKELSSSSSASSSVSALLPPGVPIEYVLAGAGYPGSKGVARFWREMEEAKGERERARLVESVVKVYKKGKGE
ncbi:hypothetical protein JCM8547_001393 [Rhodosporidiobolus lusitaniae]